MDYACNEIRWRCHQRNCPIWNNGMHSQALVKCVSQEKFCKHFNIHFESSESINNSSESKYKKQPSISEHKFSCHHKKASKLKIQNDDGDVDDCPELSDYFSDPEPDDGSSDSDDYPDLGEDSGFSDSDSDCDFDEFNQRPPTNTLRFTSEPKKLAKVNISESKTTPVVENIRNTAPIMYNIQTPPGACPVISCNYCAPPNPSMAK